jgi:hypothetical protein
MVLDGNGTYFGNIGQCQCVAVNAIDLIFHQLFSSLLGRSKDRVDIDTKSHIYQILYEIVCVCVCVFVSVEVVVMTRARAVVGCDAVCVCGG